VSRRSDAKKARRKKRQAAKDATWVPDAVMADLVTTQAAIATDLEAFDARITERGWQFDEEESDEDFVFWFYPPSAADVEGDKLAPVTTVWMSAAEDAEIVHVMLAATSKTAEFTADSLFAQLDAIEAYRAGDPPPTFS
jgi:hypothetical protein